MTTTDNKNLYHYSTKTGKVEKCGATRRACRYGAVNHMEGSLQEAEAWQQRLNQEAELMRQHIEQIIREQNPSDLKKYGPLIWKHKFNEAQENKDEEVFVFNKETGQFLGKFGYQFSGRFLEYHYPEINITQLRLEAVPTRYKVEFNDKPYQIHKSARAAKIALNKLTKEPNFKNARWHKETAWLDAKGVPRWDDGSPA